jgi:hypothetical protein
MPSQTTPWHKKRSQAKLSQAICDSGTQQMKQTTARAVRPLTLFRFVLNMDYSRLTDRKIETERLHLDPRKGFRASELAFPLGGIPVPAPPPAPDPTPLVGLVGAEVGRLPPSGFPLLSLLPANIQQRANQNSGRLQYPQ